MREYFEAEMRLLREAAQEFADNYPEQARMLNLLSVNDRDPYIERLLEGTAYLTAQIRQKIDDDIPEICESLLQHLAPQMLTPFPAMTIMQFTPRVGQLQQSYLVDKHTQVRSKLISDENEELSCYFRTCFDCKIDPLRLFDFTITEPDYGGTLLKFSLQADLGVELSALDLRNLNFYLHADFGVALALRFALLSKVKKVAITFPDEITKAPIILGEQGVIKPIFLRAEDSLLPACGRGFSGFNLLREYFLFREKFLFFSILDLKNIIWPDGYNRFNIEVHLADVLDRDHRLGKDNFRLHCVPAVNLFTGSSEPITLHHRQFEYPLIPDVDNQNSINLFSVDKVYGVDDASNQKHVYSQMPSYQHFENTDGCFAVAQRNIGGKYPLTYISINKGQDLYKEHLSCEITMSNGYYPRRFLQENTINVPVAGFPGYIQFSNIIRPTAMFNPPKRDDYRWSLVSHLALNYQSITDLATLKKVVSIYDWSQKLENQRKIDGIVKVEVETRNHLANGALMQGVEFNLTINDDCYRSLADLHLFVSVLHCFFCMYAAINFSVTTKAHCYPSGQDFIWQTLNGENYPA